MTAKPQHPIRITGVFSTLIITVLLAGTGYLLFFKTDKGINSAEDIKQNERIAFNTIGLISEAQAEYIKHDHDNNGKLEYSRFVTHLWRTIGKNNEKIQLNLIPKKLAFAIKRTRARDGYYFVHKFTKSIPESEEEVDMDAEKEWGVLMIPAANDTGYLTFFTNQSGNIYVSHSNMRRTIPNDPDTDDSWLLLKDIREVISLQQTIRDKYELLK